MSPPDFQGLYAAIRDTFWAEVDAKIAEALEWGFPQPPEEFSRSPDGDLILPEGVFQFAEFVKLDSCKHCTVRELRKFLKSAGYPKRFRDPKLVTLAGYQKALANQQQARLDANANQKRKKRLERKKLQKQKD
jgi:hypothetical protein